MSCRDCRKGWIELARGGPGANGDRVHLNSCPECRQFLEDQFALSAAARILAAEAETICAPLNIDGVLMAEFEAVRFESNRRGRRGLRWAPVAAAAIAAGAIAAGLAVLWLASARQTPKPRLRPAPVEIVKRVTVVPVPALTPKVRRRPKPLVAARDAEPEPPFLQVPYTLPLAPWERASVVRVELPVSALIAAGMPVATANTGARAQADVVVGEDGRARAFRVISISAVDSSRSIN